MMFNKALTILILVGGVDSFTLPQTNFVKSHHHQYPKSPIHSEQRPQRIRPSDSQVAIGFLHSLQESSKSSIQHTHTNTALYSTRNSNINTSKKNSNSSSSENNGITSTLISNLAVIALKLRLKEHNGVTCKCTASSRKLVFQSTVGPVTVAGRDWSSPLNLTCRAIEANVDTCTLDMAAVINRRKLILVTPAIGKAMVALNNNDFGNFLTHPLLLAQAPQVSTDNLEIKSGETPISNKFEFLREGVQIQVENNAVLFQGRCMGELWKCELQRGDGGQTTRAIIHVSHAKSSSQQISNDDIASIEMELNMIVGEFFNNLVFELDGTFLSFQDMKVHSSSSKGKGNTASSDSSDDARVLMALGITVRKFPSPGLEF